mmetsp:Transcript_13559/g.32812  ORF Transcript_13559/g.32812 Transcript_13559/m.32812 type:complete len:119 (-) Transcript_13559:1302-1658(-)
MTNCPSRDDGSTTSGLGGPRMRTTDTPAPRFSSASGALLDAADDDDDELDRSRRRDREREAARAAGVPSSVAAARDCTGMVAGSLYFRATVANRDASFPLYLAIKLETVEIFSGFFLL